MGFWKKFAGYAMMVGGVAAAPYTGGASLSLVGAGANVVANDEKAEGAKKAAAQQEAAANKAIGTQQTAAKAAQQAYAPYTQGSSAAMGALNSFMGLPNTALTAGAGPPGADVPLGSLPASTQQALGVRTPTDAPGRAVPRNPADGAATPQTQAAMQSQSGYQPTGQSVGMFAGGQLVQMQAPTGETSWVPKARAPFYAQRGAVEVA